MFAITPAPTGATWTETVLHSFTNVDGAKPNGALLFGPGTTAQPELYGTTLVGGSGGCNFNLGEGCGTVFKLTLDNHE